MTKITYLCLRTFDGGGGLESFNRSFLKALSELVEPPRRLRVLSLHDSPRANVSEQIDPAIYAGFAGKVSSFAAQATIAAARADLLIVAHINLAPVALLCKMVNPRLKIMTIVHGIEVWGALSFPKWLALRLSRRVVTVSNHTRDRVVADHAVAPARVTVFPNTIEPARSPSTPTASAELRARFGLDEDAKVLLTVARLSHRERYKGYDRVIRALPLVRQRFDNTVYIIVGKGDDSEVARVRHVIDEVGVADNVVLTGYVSDEQLRDYYAIADLFVMPSTGEGFGIVFLEAMLFGKPVVAGNKDGSVDAVCNGRLGTLVDPECVGSIAAGITKVLAKEVDEDLVNSEFLRREVVREFGFDRFRERLDTIVHQLAS